MLRSAGVLLYRRRSGTLEVLLIHPGGPYWAKRDIGAWSLPKGLIEPGEDEISCARREFVEETGFAVEGPFLDLGTFRQPSGKHLHVWACEADWDPQNLKSNVFSLEWPPRSGRTRSFPEADRAAWFEKGEALLKVSKGQRAVIEALYAAAGSSLQPDSGVAG